MADIQPHELPMLLAPMAKHLAELHNTTDAFQKAAGFEQLYLNVLEAGLQNRPTVLLVDDAVLADAVSISILAALGQDNFLSKSPSSGSFLQMRKPAIVKINQDNQKRFGIIMTTGTKQVHYFPINVSKSIECSTLNLMEDPDVSVLELLPLERGGIEALSLQVLGGARASEIIRLDPPMVQILAGKSQIPSLSTISEFYPATCANLLLRITHAWQIILNPVPHFLKPNLYCCSAPARPIRRSAPPRPGAHLVA